MTNTCRCTEDLLQLVGVHNGGPLLDVEIYEILAGEGMHALASDKDDENVVDADERDGHDDGANDHNF
jgi:hypothetical protein